jgi:hypothetical protein
MGVSSLSDPCQAAAGTVNRADLPIRNTAPPIKSVTPVKPVMMLINVRYFLIDVIKD